MAELRLYLLGRMAEIQRLVKLGEFTPQSAYDRVDELSAVTAKMADMIAEELRRARRPDG